MRLRRVKGGDPTACALPEPAVPLVRSMDQVWLVLVLELVLYVLRTMPL